MIELGEGSTRRVLSGLALSCGYRSWLPLHIGYRTILTLPKLRPFKILLVAKTIWINKDDIYQYPD